MSDFVEAPWVGNPDYRIAQDYSTTGDYPDHPRICDTYACDDEADCDCELCKPPTFDRYCEACCLSIAAHGGDPAPADSLSQTPDESAGASPTESAA